MSAYIIVEVKITNVTEYEEYKKLTPASLLAFDGKFIVRGGSAETLEGDCNPGRIVVLEFPTVDHAKKWWNSAQYAEVKIIRQRSANTQMILVEGMTQ